MVAIPAGSFQAGDPQGLDGHAIPVHTVDTDGFLMDRTEVTVQAVAQAFQWAFDRRLLSFRGGDVMNATGTPQVLLVLSNWPCGLQFSNGSFRVTVDPQMPCPWLTWYGAAAYCFFRTEIENEKQGKLEQCIDLTAWTCDFSKTGYRLPTEAEWEKAARGGLVGNHFPWTGTGDDPMPLIDGSKANYIDSGDPFDNAPSPVGYYAWTFAPINRVNLYGLQDMAGNLWEWCWDWFDGYSYARLATNGWPANPTGPPSSPWSCRVMRGGCWFTIPQHLRCAYRSYLEPGMATPFTGLRTVRRQNPNRDPSAPNGSRGRSPSIPEDTRSDGNMEGERPREPRQYVTIPPAPRLAARFQDQVEADWLEADGLTTAQPDYAAAATRYAELVRNALTLVEHEGGHPQVSPALEALLRQVELNKGREAPDMWKQLYLGLRRLRREILLSSPLLDFDSILAVHGGPPRYTSNICDQYLGRWSRAGRGIVRITDWKTAPRVKELISSLLPTGAVQRLSLSYDAKKAIFSFADHSEPSHEKRRFLLYELDLIAQRVRQVTGRQNTDPLPECGNGSHVLVEDFDPCYLPDGDIAFVSTRCGSFSRCHAGRYAPSYVLYRTRPDGSGVQRLSFAESNEWTPFVRNDGTLMFTRWDYVNRHEVLFQGLWTCRPDGSGFAHLYGNNTVNPCVVAQAGQVPGSRRLIALAAAHHSISCGPMILLDPDRGENGEQPVTRLNPEMDFPETEGWPMGSYMTPWPLNEDLFLVAYSPDRVPCHWEIGRFNAYGLYLFDRFGGRELICRTEDGSLFQPIPLRPRQTPPVVADARRTDMTNAVVIVQNIDNSPHDFRGGAPRRIRVVRLYEQEGISAPPRSVVGIEIAKAALGTAPVQTDGSAAFTVPAQVPVLFQVVDSNNMAVMSMRSQVFFQPGEIRGCAGCHEDRRSAVPVQPAFPTARPESLRPVPGPAYPGGFSFTRSVQPVLDRYCISCHGLQGQAGGISLLGTPTEYFNVAYEQLISRPGLVALARRKQETASSEPRDYGSHGGRLAAFLLNEHKEFASIDEAGFERLATWLDLNAPYYGDYAFIKAERRTVSEAGLAELRRHLKTLNYTLLGDVDKAPVAALVNVAAPLESRALNLPLSEVAGGWARFRPLWESRKDPGYLQMLQKVMETVGPGTNTSSVKPLPRATSDASVY